MSFPDTFCVLTSLPSVFLAPWAEFALGPSTLVDPFLADSSITVELLPLKELDFRLQKPTGPSSGVVVSIVLVSPGLDCPGVSSAEVCATCLRCYLW